MEKKNILSVFVAMLVTWMLHTISKGFISGMLAGAAITVIVAFQDVFFPDSDNDR